MDADRLIFALDGDLAPLKAKYAQAEGDATKSGERVSANFKKATSGMAAGASDGLGKLRRELEDVEPAGHRAARGIEVSRRELLYLFREIATGDLRRIPSTLLLIGSHLAGVTTAGIATAAAVLAIPAAFAVAAYQSERSLARIRTALAMTGYASGVTASQAGQIAGAIASGSSYSQLGARGLVGELAGGMVPAGSIGRAGIAATQYELGAGIAEKDAVKVITDMFADPEKSAAQLNAEMNLLTYAQTEQVKRLQESGEYQKAGDIILKAFSDRTKEAADQAGFFAIALAKAEGTIGGAMDFIGKKILGVGLTPKEELSFLQGGGQKYSYGVVPEYDSATRAARIAQLQREIADEERRAKAGTRQKELFDAYAVANAGTNAAAITAQQYADKVKLLNKAISEETDAHKRVVLVTQRDATERASKNLRTPAQIAAEAAADALTVARASPEQQAAVAARLAAKRNYESNLANPSMTGADALSIYNSQLKAADASLLKLGAKQAEHLRLMRAEAEASLTVAAAFGISTKAGEQARIAQEAHLAVVRKEIAPSMEAAEAAALLAKAFGDESKALAERGAKEALVIAGLRGEVGAGGSPAAIARAGARTSAMATAQPLYDLATTADDLKKAGKAFNEEFQRNLDKLDLERQKWFQGQTFSARQTVAGLQTRAQAFGAGATPDDMRHVEAMQQAFDDLVREGFDPTDKAFAKQLATLGRLNIAISDLKDNFDKLSKEAKDLASDITGPLKNFLTQGGNPLDMLANIGQNILGTLVENNIIDPLQKKLEGLFGGLLGTPGLQLGSTPANAMWVQMIGAGGLGGGGNLGGSLLGSLFGGGSNPFDVVGGITGGIGGSGINQAAKIASGGGFFSSIFDFFGGLFDDGGTLGPGQWGIKSGKPEIIQGGLNGVSIAPLAAPMVSAAFSRMATNAANSNDHQQRGREGSRDGMVVHNWIFNGPTDRKRVLEARSQMEGAAARFVNRGGRSI